MLSTFYGVSADFRFIAIGDPGYLFFPCGYPPPPVYPPLFPAFLFLSNASTLLLNEPSPAFRFFFSGPSSDRMPFILWFDFALICSMLSCPCFCFFTTFFPDVCISAFFSY